MNPSIPPLQRDDKYPVTSWLSRARSEINIKAMVTLLNAAAKVSLKDGKFGQISLLNFEIRQLKSGIDIGNYPNRTYAPYSIKSGTIAPDVIFLQVIETHNKVSREVQGYFSAAQPNGFTAVYQPKSTDLNCPSVDQMSRQLEKTNLKTTTYEHLINIIDALTKVQFKTSPLSNLTSPAQIPQFKVSGVAPITQWLGAIAKNYLGRKHIVAEFNRAAESFLAQNPSYRPIAYCRLSFKYLHPNRNSFPGEGGNVKKHHSWVAKTLHLEVITSNFKKNPRLTTVLRLYSAGQTFVDRKQKRDGPLPINEEVDRASVEMEKKEGKKSAKVHDLLKAITVHLASTRREVLAVQRMPDIQNAGKKGEITSWIRTTMQNDRWRSFLFRRFNQVANEIIQKNRRLPLTRVELGFKYYNDLGLGKERLWVEKMGALDVWTENQGITATFFASQTPRSGRYKEPTALFHVRDIDNLEFPIMGIFSRSREYHKRSWYPTLITLIKRTMKKMNEQVVEIPQPQFPVIKSHQWPVTYWLGCVISNRTSLKTAIQDFNQLALRITKKFPPLTFLRLDIQHVVTQTGCYTKHDTNSFSYYPRLTEKVLCLYVTGRKKGMLPLVYSSGQLLHNRTNCSAQEVITTCPTDVSSMANESKISSNEHTVLIGLISAICSQLAQSETLKTSNSVADLSN